MMSSSSNANTVMPVKRQRDDSHVVELQDGQRLGHVVAIQYLTYTTDEGERVIDETFLYNAIAAFLGYKHFNERRGDILPQLPQVLGECDFYWTFEFRDSQWSGLEAAKQLAMATGQLQQQEEEEETTTKEHTTTTIPIPLSTEHPTSEHPSSEQPTSEQPTEPPSSQPTATPSSASSSTPTQATSTGASTYGNGAFASVEPPRTAPPRTNTPIRTLPPRTSMPQHTTTSSTNPRGGERRQLQLQSQQQSTLPHLHPFAIFGAYWSSVSKPLSTLSGALEIPQISGASTSAALDDNFMFARTVATNDGDAKAAIRYYTDIGVTHLACLYIQDSWGVNYHASLQSYARQYGIHLYSYPYDKCCVELVIAEHMAQLHHGHVFAIMHNWKQVLGHAYNYGIIGTPQFAWMAAEEKKWTGTAFALDAATESHLAHALHGIGTLNIHFELIQTLEDALEEMAFNPQLQQEFINIHGDPSIFEGYEFPRYRPTGFTNSIFDAMVALGLTACNMTRTTTTNHNTTTTNKTTTSTILQPLFTGPEFYQKLVTTTNFHGASGHVSFDPRTGTRHQEGMRYSIDYILLSDERTTTDTIRFESKLAAVVGGDAPIDHRAPFVYHDNTTNVPPSLPPVDGNLNLLPTGAKIAGYVLGSIVLAASVGFLAWTIRRRNVFVVRASQPIFLGQLCVGTLIMSLYVFPASLPPASTSLGPDRVMDIACMSQLWLLFLGFVTAFSAVFAKTYRLNQLMNSGRGMRRIRVDAKDVQMPFAILMTLNVTMLLCVTFAAPFRYHRVEVDSYDRFGRSIESYGTCRPDNNIAFLFVGIMFTANCMVVLVALYQAWKARNLPTEFSESYYLALSLASFTETLCLGGPIMLVVHSHPTSWYLMSTIIVCVGSMTILLPIMLPKYWNRRYVGSTFATVGEAVGRKRGGNISGLDVGVDGSSFVRLNSSLNGMSSELDDFGSSLRRGMMSVTRRPSYHTSGSSKRKKRRESGRESGISRRLSSFKGRVGGSVSSWWGAGSSHRMGLEHEHAELVAATTGPESLEQRRLNLEQSIRQLQNMSGIQMSDSSEEGDEDDEVDEDEGGAGRFEDEDEGTSP
ncbi:acid type B receptor subunit 2 [Seminavis robusta]|uniref:Acid type B receptor subunit 2 n=1 Tax=Seminavis robusta TaxID=568900 RepID=A0A9N8H5F2_9STRA|nr:acid type B receptor subunit 2 [Seminavis robusta]|eukprot:Sro141_g065900.1 acid type B receptor subunit 2 (1092) ;mRNA; r:75971-79328